MAKAWKIFIDGIWDSNPVLRLILGICPTLAVTNLAFNGFIMGISTLFVLLASEIVTSIIKGFVPKKARIPIFIVVIASFVTIIDLLLHAYLPVTHKLLGVFVPLIVVNCIILGRVETFSSKNPFLLSIVDAIGMGIGFTLALTVLGSIRELLGFGAIFSFQVAGSWFNPLVVMILPAGAFITLGMLMALMNYLDDKLNNKLKSKSKAQTEQKQVTS